MTSEEDVCGRALRKKEKQGGRERKRDRGREREKEGVRE